MKKNFALIGYGSWGKKVSEEIKINKNFNLKYIVSKSVKQNNKDIKFYKNLEEILSFKKLDCIYVAKNPNTNFETLDELKYKKIPVILEKPISSSTLNCNKIINLIHKYQIKVFTNLPNIHADTYDFSKKFISNNKNEIKKIIIHEGDFGPKNINIHPILDWGIHPISYLFNILGVENLHNIRHKEIISFNKHGYGLSRFDLDFNNKFSIKIITGNSFKKKIRLLKIILKNGDIFINDFINHQIWKNYELILKSKSSPLQNLLNKFAHSIEFENYQGGIKEIYNSYDSIKVIEKFI